LRYDKNATGRIAPIVESNSKQKGLKKH
jgi:hypothetical protein